MGDITLNISNTIASIQRLETALPGAMLRAVENTAKIFLERIIDKTPAPPTPPGQVYIRTGRLVGGWANGFQRKVVSQTEISLVATNPVPYAFFVEVAGPGFPPRGGVFMVTRSSFETLPDFQQEIQAAWNGIP